MLYGKWHWLHWTPLKTGIAVVTCSEMEQRLCVNLDMYSPSLDLSFFVPHCSINEDNLWNVGNTMKSGTHTVNDVRKAQTRSNNRRNTARPRCIYIRMETYIRLRLTVQQWSAIKWYQGGILVPSREELNTARGKLIGLHTYACICQWNMF